MARLDRRQRRLIASSQRVRQGQIIGRVGSTGMSTGPHLHYQMWKNGKYVDAMKVPLPRSTPLNRALMAEFKQSVERFVPMLDAVPQP